MRSLFVKGVVVGALVAAVVTMTGTAFAGSGIGGIFQLGKTNTANRTSTLAGTINDPLLRLSNSGTGAALALNVQPGTPPLVVSSTAHVANLDADTVDGKHASELAQGSSSILQQRRSVSLPATELVTLVSVPGFGDLKVEVQAYYDQEGGLWRADMWSPTFVNNQAGEDVDWVFGSAGRRTVAAGESSTRQDSEWSLGTYRLFLNDSGHMASVDVHCWVKGDSFEAVSMGIVQ